MKTQCTWLLALATSILFATGTALAQAPAPVQFAGGYPSPGYPTSVPYGAIQQAGCHSCAGTGCDACGGGAGYGCDSGACDSTCGPGGCGLLGGGGVLGNAMLARANNRFGGYDTMRHGQQNGPFGGGGCCTPIWHDFHIEAMHLRRDDIGANTNFTSNGPGGPIVLSSNDLDLEDAVGLRATYAYLIAPATNLEATYFGMQDWSDSASVSAGNDLWSVFSDFGAVFPQVGQQGFPQTVDNAVFHGIEYSSELHNVELNLRQRWTSANCLLHGSYLAGVRYVSLHEEFSHNTRVANGGYLNYDVETENDMVGFQLGGDLFVCISPRFKIGAEVEGGIYGNDAEYAGRVNTREVTTGPPVVVVDANPINEFDDQTDVSVVGEASLVGLFRVTPRFTIRGGYTLLYMDGLALASENFNSTSSPFSSTGRPVSVRNQGDAFFHGANLGFTWMW